MTYNRFLKFYGDTIVFNREDVKQLDYLLTPHITLAYYNIDVFDIESAKKLEDIVQELNDVHMEIEFSLEMYL